MVFTKEQREAVTNQGAVPMSIDGIDCIVVRADLFEKFRSDLSDGLTHDELRAMLALSTRGSDWLDPAMDVYEEYDKNR